MSLIQTLEDTLKKRAWLLGAGYLTLFVIFWFLIDADSSKQEFAEKIILLLIGYVIGTPIGATTALYFASKEDSTELMKQLAFILGIIFLIIFTIYWFFFDIECKSQFVEEVISALLGYVVGTPLGATTALMLKMEKQ